MFPESKVTEQAFGAELRDPPGEQLRFAYRDAAADGPACPGVEDAAQRCAALDAAAVLHLERGFRGDAFQYRQVLRFGGLRAVEIDHVQAACARLFEAQRRFERVAVVGFPARIVALREADAAAADEVRCGNHFDHA